MKRQYVIIFLNIISLLLLSGCFEKTQKDDSPVIAKVNDQVFTYNQMTGQIPQEYLKTLGYQEKQDFIEQWIRQELLYQYALKEDLKKDNQIKFRLNQFERQLLADEILQRYLKKDTTISDDDAEKYYEKNREMYIRDEPEIRISHIVVEDRQKALELRKRIVNGENFVTLAKEFSVDPSNINGGDLGYFTESEITDDLTRTAFNLQLNEVSQPIQTPFGYHLILVTERYEAESFRDFDQVKTDVVNQLILMKQKDLTDSLLTSLRNDAMIETFPENLPR